MLAVNMKDGVETIKKRFEDDKLTYKPVRKKNDEITKAYGVRVSPTLYIIGPDGKIAFSRAGGGDDGIRGVLNKLAPEKNP